MKKQFVALLIVALIAGGLFAQGSKETTKTSYTFGGSSTVAPIANTAIPAFEAENPSVAITYETLGSSVGIKQLQEGTLSLAGSSRELKQSELDAGLIPTTIALDGLSVAVNKDVGISNLTMAQLASIFAGDVTNWKEVGGANETIQLVVRDETSGTYGSFKEIVLDKAKKELSKNAIVAKENGEVATKIASTPGAIGYIGMAFGKIVTEAGGRVLTIEGVEPNAENVKDGKYPISRSLYMVSKGQLEGVGKQFVDFLLGTKGQAIVLDSGFIPLN
ncbi:MAG: phosphate ABC transporter substrate-binding protein [Sphaerochaeta sp.]|jgi:phosphate transport system substrate-binding protein|nr:phosphate ABC transporter substrate-binding protein [Sphaerochaeta sp.]MCH3919795.1 phosphate ABC transporter substrate-binding protein [Sphaerochaeta sp.]MCI2045701.1 phosphate ABC transporter substrate-binding protein [Sphaerochaeta sp.]MCI2076443.1 phosphate ABC transporter substrate-binding protein [Sphaerochaeta sp.]MCI2096641.1 phosphate ABC transporter substrate-binding protein [Sphaerochaeta sp.]